MNTITSTINSLIHMMHSVLPQHVHLTMNDGRIIGWALWAMLAWAIIRVMRPYWSSIRKHLTRRNAAKVYDIISAIVCYLFWLPVFTIITYTAYFIIAGYYEYKTIKFEKAWLASIMADADKLTTSDTINA